MFRAGDDRAMTLKAPRDKGLTHLGVVCEAFGWVQVAGASVTALLLFLSATGAPDPWGGARPEVGEVQSRLFLAAIVFFAGSLLLALAGRGLSSGSARAARVYVVGGGVAGVAFTYVVGRDAGAAALVAVSAVAVCWPLLVALAIWRRPRSTDELFPCRFAGPEDGGAAGLANLMLFASAIELVAAGGAVWFAFSAYGAPWPTVPTVVLAVLLVIRAGVQLLAVRTLPNDVRPATHYGVIGMASAAVFLFASIAVAWEKELLVFSVGAAATLFSWPYVVRRFVRRTLQSVVDGGSNATDAGITAAAWLVLFLGVHEAVSQGLGILTASSDEASIGLEGAILAIVPFVQVWTGVELLILSGRMRIASGVYAVCGLIAAIVAWCEVVDASGDAGLGGIIAAAKMALPLITILVVFRRPPTANLGVGP